MTDTPDSASLTTPESPAAPSGDIIARAGRYYRWTRYLVIAMTLGFGIAFFKDGFYTWPEEQLEAQRAEARGERPKSKPHTNTDIAFQKFLGLILPPLGIGGLAWFLYTSRGEYRLSGDTLTVAGHPPVPLQFIRSLDKSFWDRKGIAYVDYELPAPSVSGRIKLDDFVYERPPTDAIVERIEHYLAAATPHTTEAAVESHETRRSENEV